MKLVLTLIVVGSCLLSCSDYRQVTKRYQLPSSEGLVKFVENHDKEKNALFDATLTWISEAMHQESINLITEDNQQGIVTFTALAPVSGRQAPELCRYQLSMTISENRIDFHFKTMRLTDQFYPSRNQLKELKQYYQRLKSDILKFLEKATQAKS